DHVGDLSLEAQIFSAVTGIDITPEESYEKGEMLCTLERAIAARDGRTRKDDTLHEIYFEKEDAGGRRYRREDLEKAKSEYYERMGWDVPTGVPGKAAMEKLGLEGAAEVLEKRGRPQTTGRR
ncbi:MAG TPA: aldehyde ferredoxin oxidoreductase C-terminal domain-containing protein, partial [Thermodesulfobacteriota bacterium]|nr:aldehyde ferredoxin oxidoreductase C-terminal domain-containing protein [Thermodesulfobacteriota bacterium]